MGCFAEFGLLVGWVVTLSTWGLHPAVMRQRTWVVAGEERVILIWACGAVRPGVTARSIWWFELGWRRADRSLVSWPNIAAK